jgi:trehalose monomycolate/heme transporter
MLAALTILPAGLAVLGTRVDALSVRRLLPWLRHRGPASPHSQRSFWYRASGLGTRRPGLVMVLTLIPLVWLGAPFLRINFALPDAHALPPSHESRQVADVLSSDFPGNETQPIQIVVRSAQPALEPVTLGALVDYTRDLAALPGVRRVDSLVTLGPGLDKPVYAAFYSEPNRAQDARAAQAAARFSRGNYSLINVLYEGDPFAPESQQLVKRVRNLAIPSGLTVQVGGDPSQLVDTLSSLRNSAPAAFGIIALVMFVLLFLMLGSVVVPLKALLLNILSLSASFGTLVWVFQDGNLAHLLGVSTRGSIDAMQPVLIFGLAFGGLHSDCRWITKCSC